MEVFLGREAYEEIKALSLLWGKMPCDGFLLGHSRGPMVFIEKTWPARKGFFSGPAAYWQLETAFAGRIVGFFSYKPETQRLAKILQPLACGKVYLKVDRSQKNSLRFKCFFIEFDDRFHLAPCPLQIERHGTNE
ncbi:MAG: hypothetical protein ACUVR0_05630 [Candidatus Aminicenantales bacterium]